MITGWRVGKAPKRISLCRRVTRQSSQTHKIFTCCNVSLQLDRLRFDAYWHLIGLYCFLHFAWLKCAGVNVYLNPDNTFSLKHHLVELLCICVRVFIIGHYHEIITQNFPILYIKQDSVNRKPGMNVRGTLGTLGNVRRVEHTSSVQINKLTVVHNDYFQTVPLRVLH